MDAVFLKVFNISVTACWLCLAVVLLRFCLKKAPKGLICLLWAVVGLRLIFPFSLESVFSLIPSTETVPESIISGGTPPTANIGAPSVNMGAPNVNVGAPNVNGMVTPSAPVVTPPTAEPVDLMQVAVTVASYVWIAGVVLMLCYMAFSYLRVRLRVREAVPTEKGVWICDSVDTPFILGIVRPRIYLPSDLEEGDRKFVLAHERAHLRRWDHAWKPLGFLLLAVYWFQPLLWVAYVLLCRDIEFACDEKVIAEMGQDARRAYSGALVKCSVLRKQISACPVAFGETNVVSRVKRVMHYKKPGFWIVLIAVIAVIVTAVCFLTDPVSDREDDDPTEQETTGQETTGMGEETTGEPGAGDNVVGGSKTVFQLLLEESHNEKITFRADTFLQDVSLSWWYSFDVAVENGNIYLEDRLCDRVSYVEDYQVEYLPSMISELEYQDDEQSSEVLSVLEEIQNQKGCYMLEINGWTTLGEKLAVYSIDNVLYFLRIDSIKYITRIHSAVIEITPESGTTGIELEGDSELIRSLTKYLQEFWMCFDMLDTSVEIKIDEIKKGKQPLLVDFDPLNYYFVCGYYNATHDGDESYDYCCVTEYTWVRFANANEITERYKGENIVVAFQINKAASVKDIQSETADVPNVEHFQMYTPNFDNGVNTNPSVLFDQVFIYLNSSDKSNVYHSVSVYNHEWVTLPCVKMDGQVYIMVPLYTIRSNGDHYSEAPARDLGKYYDALMNIMEPEPYGITRDNGAINFYGLFEVGNFVNCVIK